MSQWKVTRLRSALAELVLQVMAEPCSPTALNDAIAEAGRALKATEEPADAPAYAVPEFVAEERL